MLSLSIQLVLGRQKCLFLLMVMRVYQMLLTKNMFHFSVKQLEQQMTKFRER